MKLSISNIGWEEKNDKDVYKMMTESGFDGLEIAPTRIIPNHPYDKKIEAENWANTVKKDYGFVISSMQSIWYGRAEKIFGSKEERQFLINYSKKAIDFAKAIGCKNLVFGCPKNRNKPDDVEEDVAIDFFKEIGDYADAQATVIGMEANPAIYNTNFINDTKSALDLIKKVDSKGFRLNLDVGTMIENCEDITILKGNEHLISHVHISEPWLKTIIERKIHNELSQILSSYGYDGFVSIEVGRQTEIDALMEMMCYVKKVFG